MMLGEQLMSMLYHEYRAGSGSWESVPQYKMGDFVPVATA